MPFSCHYIQGTRRKNDVYKSLQSVGAVVTRVALGKNLDPGDSSQESFQATQSVTGYKFIIS